MWLAKEKTAHWCGVCCTHSDAEVREWKTVEVKEFECMTRVT